MLKIARNVFDIPPLGFLDNTSFCCQTHTHDVPQKRHPHSVRLLRNVPLLLATLLSTVCIEGMCWQLWFMLVWVKGVGLSENFYTTMQQYFYGHACGSTLGHTMQQMRIYNDSLWSIVVSSEVIRSVLLKWLLSHETPFRWKLNKFKRNVEQD